MNQEDILNPPAAVEMAPTPKTSFAPSESSFGITVAIFAAVLAINDLGGGRFGGDELALSNEKANNYQWYQSKGIKESLVEGQISTLKSLIAGGVISSSKAQEMASTLQQLEENKARYKKEKREILMGSKAVGKENWVQDVDGEYGKVVGAKELEAQIEALAKAGDAFDFSSLALQVSLVVGALGLLLKGDSMKARFYFLTITMGSLGALACVWAYALAMRA